MPQYFLRNYSYNVSPESISDLSLEIACINDNRTESPIGSNFISRFQVFLEAMNNTGCVEISNNSIKEIAEAKQTKSPKVIKKDIVKKDIINSAFDRLEV